MIDEESRDRDDLEQALVEGLGVASEPDFESWKKTYDEALYYLNPLLTRQTRRRRRRIARAAVFATTACVLVAVLWIGATESESGVAAAAVRQLQQARAITWVEESFVWRREPDGSNERVEIETTKMSYMEPGLYLEEHLDAAGNVKWTSIKNLTTRKQIDLEPMKKTATTRDISPAEGDDRGPFMWIADELKKHPLEFIGLRKTEAMQVNVFRVSHASKDTNEPYSFDFWIDRTTKRVCRVLAPGANLFDPERELKGKDLPKDTLVYVLGHRKRDIKFDAQLDASLFEIAAPAGYSVEQEQKLTVTEEQMVEYLKALAEFNGGAFTPEYYPPQNAYRNATDKPEQERTTVEHRLIELTDSYRFAGIFQTPVFRFFADHAEPDSFRYIGKGVTLGDGSRIVCWYRLKGKSEYRVVLGDLSVKDQSKDELPIDVQSLLR